MSCKNGVTHYAGCECHEQAWSDRLDLERQEILKLRRIIAKELTENDELGSEFVYVQALKEENDKLRAALAVSYNAESVDCDLRELDLLKEQLKKACEALEFYASTTRWEWTTP